MKTRSCIALVAGVWLLAAAAPLLAAVDPFYSVRLQEGIAAAERGAHADAVRSLRIACFGMLDDEPQLADCLVRLALAQAASGDQEAFSQTFRRLVEGEEMVGLYSKAGLPAELTGRFEAKVVEWIPRAALATAAGFQRFAADPRESQLAALSPRARRDRLAKLEKEEPKAVRWPLLAARLEKEQNEPKAALAAAERTLALAPDLAEARCLRGWGKSGVGKHAEALADLAGCRGGDAAFAIAELESRVELQQWSEADALLATLTAEQRKLPGVGELAKRVERGTQAAATRPTPTPQPPPTSARTASLPASAPAAPPAAAAAAAAPAPAPVPTPTPAAAGPVGGALAPADETALARVQSLLAGAKTAAEIEAAYAAAAALATRYPAHQRVQHTAAEIAYRASRWSDAVRHFRRGGDPGEGQPLLLFYFAVSLWESGAQQEAVTVMRRCDGKLRPTPFVQSYRDRILGAPAGS
ncbi:MAG TPA: hypothetical protein VFS60_20410 [Thermoanaerobaculia bacterium]|nr:hypothetical protein [Thermoanaerobaculia bacterium]